MERNRTILHIDDDPSILKLVSAKLAKHDYDVVTLDDPTRAAQELITTGARLVLLDIDMPQIDGLTLLKKMKENDGGIQVVMVTGMVSMSTVLQSMRWGAEACVFKPIVDFQPLLKAVEAAFEKIDCWWLSLDDLQHRKLDNEHSARTSSR